MDKTLREMRKALAAHRRPNPFASDLFKSRFEVWHVPAAVQRKLASSGYGFSGQSYSQQRKTWRAIWEQADVLELRLQCLWPLLMQPREQRLSLWADIQWYCARIENWCEADYLASMVAECLEQSNEAVVPVLSRWNRHRNPWLRRQSLTGLFYYQRLRRRQPDKALVLSQLSSQLDAPEYYVQKAVGWTLRETWQAYPQALADWLDAELPRVQAAALRTMLEKASPEQARQWRSRHRISRNRGG